MGTGSTAQEMGEFLFKINLQCFGKSYDSVYIFSACTHAALLTSSEQIWSLLSAFFKVHHTNAFWPMELVCRTHDACNIGIG